MNTYGLPYWLDLERPAFPMLDGDATADVVIVGAEYLAGRIAGATSDVERRFGHLFEQMRPDRVSARWGPWKSIHD